MEEKRTPKEEALYDKEKRFKGSSFKKPCTPGVKVPGFYSQGKKGFIREGFQ